MNQHQGKYSKIKFHLIFLFFIITFSSFMSVASAGAPPLDNRPGYLLPHLFPPYINQSAGDCLTEMDSFKAFNHPFRPPPFFLNMSENYAFINISCEKTDERYVSEVWYFTDLNEFSMQRESLFRYLTQHGTVSNVTLDLSMELAQTNDPWITGLRAKHISTTQYTAPETSGYFIIFSTDFFPGENYYIAYYGVVGHSDLADDTPQIKTLIMSCFPGFVEKQDYHFDPASPGTLPAPLPAVLVILAIGCTVLVSMLIQKRRRGS